MQISNIQMGRSSTDICSGSWSGFVLVAALRHRLAGVSYEQDYSLKFSFQRVSARKTEGITSLMV